MNTTSPSQSQSPPSRIISQTRQPTPPGPPGSPGHLQDGSQCPEQQLRPLNPNPNPNPDPKFPASPAPAATTASHDTKSAAASQKSPAAPRKSSLPFSFPPLFFKLSNNTSVTSLAPSTAEGKPIPLDDSTAAHRTSALRELNHHFPSPVARHRCTKSTGAQSTTYSQPVIVRTYSGPSPHSCSNSNSGIRTGFRRPPPSATASSFSFFSPGAPFRPISGIQHGGLLNMARGNAKKKSPWPWRQGQDQQDDTLSYPPLEAYTFKSFIANLQAESNEIDQTLDNIAGIYARNRYSLSNQYEVHMTPHGSGTTFVNAVPPGARRRGQGKTGHVQGGPTLQAVPSDGDDHGSGARGHRPRRSGGRRRSVAYGTLETIMSSSRSSDEDKSKKKPAAEIAEEVRGRAASKSSQGSKGSFKADQKADGPAHESPDSGRPVVKTRSASFANAIIHADSSKQQAKQQDSSEMPSPRGSAAALVSEPALPQTSSSHMEVRAAPGNPYDDSQPQSPDGSASSETHAVGSMAPADQPKPSSSTGRLLSGFSHWVPWTTAMSGVTAVPQQQSAAASASHAEGSLRDLLRAVGGDNGKGKGKGKAVGRPE